MRGIRAITFKAENMLRLLGALTMFGLLAGCSTFGLNDDNGPTIDPHGYSAEGRASYYGAQHQGKRTASGERFDQNALTAAHRQLPFGTRLLVTNLSNSKTVVVKVNDRGPHTRSRLIDLSKAAAEQLGMVGDGVASVRIQTVGD